jgi:outer membrane protein assembly factor BamB
MGSVNAACVNFRPAPAPLAPEAAGNAPAQVWTSTAGRRFTGPVAIEDETFYGAGVDRKVYAVELSSGIVKWSSRLSGIIAGGLLVSGDTIYAGTSRPQGRVFAIDRLTGHRYWQSSTGLVGAPLSMWKGVLLASTQRGDLVGLNPVNGEVKWRRHLGTARVAPVPAGDDHVMVATVDSLFVVGVSDGQVLHRVRSPGTVLSPWLAFRDEFIAGTTDSLVVAVHADDLSVSWRVNVDAPVLASPAVSGDTIYVATRRGTLYRIVADSAPLARPIVALHWPITAPVTVLNGEILLGGADGTIRALTVSGEERWRLQLWRPVDLAPVPLGDGILALGGNGDLHRYRR